MSTAAPASASSQLVPGCPGACKVLLILPPSSLLVSSQLLKRSSKGHWSQKYGHSPGEKHSEKGGIGAVSGHVHSDPGERMREAQGLGGEIESGTCSFDLWFAWLLGHSWGSPYVLQVEQCFYYQS